jgi:hypothetical protein
MLPEWQVNQVARQRDGGIEFVSMPPSQNVSRAQQLAAAQ